MYFINNNLSYLDIAPKQLGDPYEYWRPLVGWLASNTEAIFFGPIVLCLNHIQP